MKSFMLTTALISAALLEVGATTTAPSTTGASTSLAANGLTTVHETAEPCEECGSYWHITRDCPYRLIWE
ncbi:hypothetical protein PGT21_030102 [Puccinia graminis f. sp. tritici]|uniref:CCHC-type domain-containing protein n=1 Tax=Puccinia graminis f. sp. tritici TaxID=56615 RepID=A0A5B0R6J8_PUCGR|nr:hypothetical protein PGT21_030102 [Puccinia graminis f. sp. tritici]KAA1120695.1 hypothetical protein PGTUg99_023715 [Puccinia graminis f. sp. tritici]KAA1121170.1 hypothetical protein PGTUg99_022136 [Puccinia graminis f. sp. tritici]